MRKAMITGAMGQDAAYLACVLLADGCEVRDIHRRTGCANSRALQEQNLLGRRDMHPVQGELSPPNSMIHMVETDAYRARALGADAPANDLSELPRLDAIGPLRARAEAGAPR